MTIIPTISGTCNYSGESNNLGDTHLMDRVFADMANDGDGECYIDFLTTYSLDNTSSCIDSCYAHGPGRADGGNDLLDRGCRNYAIVGYYKPSYDTAYWININKIADENARADLLNNIRYQVELWNAIEMAGIGKLVNFYEIGIGLTQKPTDSNGHPIIEISPERLNSGVYGVYIHSDKTIKISYDEKTSKPLFDTDTIVHELGHVLGLKDLESGWAVDDYGTHKTLMSYNRGTQQNDLYNAIKYPDIQGVAVALGMHVCKDSDFVRYVNYGTLYRHICFYCDRIDIRKSAISGSLPVADSNTCTHDYKELVSAGTTHWKKCAKCTR